MQHLKPDTLYLSAQGNLYCNAPRCAGDAVHDGGLLPLAVDDPAIPIALADPKAAVSALVCECGHTAYARGSDGKMRLKRPLLVGTRLCRACALFFLPPPDDEREPYCVACRPEVSVAEAAVAELHLRSTGEVLP